VLERGVRTDQNVPGYGLGLAMVHDTVDLYAAGKLAIDHPRSVAHVSRCGCRDVRLAGELVQGPDCP